MNRTAATTFIICIVLGFAFTIWHINDVSKSRNYIHNFAPKIKNHSYFKENNKEKHVVVGSSAVSGNIIPINSTLADQLTKQSGNAFYNFGLMEARLMDSLALLTQLNHQPPKTVLYGFNPGNFDSITGKYSVQNFQHLAPFVSDEIRLIFDRERWKTTSFLSFSILDSLKIPNSITLQIQTLLFNLKNAIYGPLFTREVFKLKTSRGFNIDQTRLLLKYFISFVRNNLKSEIYIYFEPQIFESDTDQQEYDQYISKVKIFLIDEKVTFMDLTNSMDKNSENFLDYIHLQPQGNKILAEKILEILYK